MSLKFGVLEADIRIADEKLFIKEPIHVQLSFDNLVIPEKAEKE